jgi:non-ribosomal peptide synthetase component F
MVGLLLYYCKKSLLFTKVNLLPRPRPYRDYIAWLQQQNRAQAELFWRQKLKGFTAPTPLIGRKVTSNCNSYKIQQIQLSSEITANLRSIARQYQLTLNTLVQGAWAILLSRYSGENDIVFGTTVSGRPPNLTGADTMVGLFINTLPVRVKVEEDFLKAWLQTLQAQQVECQQYEYSPLVDIQQKSELPPGVSLFESLLVFENYPTFKVQNGDLEIRSDRSSEQTNYPLTVLAAVDQVLSLKISYNSDRFGDDAIARMLGHLQTLLKAIAANPQVRLSELPLLTPRRATTNIS